MFLQHIFASLNFPPSGWSKAEEQYWCLQLRHQDEDGDDNDDDDVMTMMVLVVMMLVVILKIGSIFLSTTQTTTSIFLPRVNVGNPLRGKTSHTDWRGWEIRDYTISVKSQMVMMMMTVTKMMLLIIMISHRLGKLRNRRRKNHFFCHITYRISLCSKKMAVLGKIL